MRTNGNARGLRRAEVLCDLRGVVRDQVQVHALSPQLIIYFVGFRAGKKFGSKGLILLILFEGSKLRSVGLVQMILSLITISKYKARLVNPITHTQETHLAPQVCVMGFTKRDLYLEVVIKERTKRTKKTIRFDPKKTKGPIKPKKATCPEP